MIAVDTNILIAADRVESPWHAAARARLEELTGGVEPWGLPLFVCGEYLRVVTHPRVFNPPTPLDEALGNIHTLLQSPGARLLRPGDRYLDLLHETLIQADARGNLVFDAMIVALCREHGVGTILTEDRDFKRFEGVRVAHLR